MALTTTVISELEPSVHNLIKKYLGFSEPTLLSAAIHALQDGSTKEQMTTRLATLLDHHKASKLSSKIDDIVDDYYMTRGLQRPGGGSSSRASRKRGFHDEPEDSPTKKQPKPSNGNTAPAPSPSSQPQQPNNVASTMTTDQIRSMMSNTLKEIAARKTAMSGIKYTEAAVSAAPGVSLPGPAALPPPSATTEDKSKTIAALQAQIAARLNKVGIAAVAPPLPSAPTSDVQRPPTSLILDSEGRTVDAMGHEIQLGHHVPTLKANLRAKKKDETKEEHSSSSSSSFQDESSKFHDPRVAAKGAARTKRSGFLFVEPGRYQKEGSRLRMKAQLEKLQADISTIARKTGITSAAQLAKLVPKGDVKARCPDVEWWDALILPSGATYGRLELKAEAITNLIEHPIQMMPLEPATPAHVPVFLTKKEIKKLRRQNRREAWKEKQDKLRLGLINPDQPKVKMSNLMRVLGTEAVQDPTKVESNVREQVAKRKAVHEKMNADRRLTPEERKDRNIRKLKEDTSGGLHVAVYRLKHLQNPAKKFKVETNARQLYMTGTVVLYEDVNVVVVEGGPKQHKKYKQLMLKRIKWSEETFKDKEGAEVENQCALVWEGQTKERNFGEVKFKQCPSESFAREHFQKAGVEHYWDQAYSGAVLEASSSV